MIIDTAETKAAESCGGHKRLDVGAALALAVGILILPSGRAATNLTAWNPLFKGVDHAVGTNTPSATYPNLQVMHVIRVDLKDPDIELFATPRISNYVSNVRETAGYTVSDFLGTNRLQVAINGNYFDPGDYYLPRGTPMRVDGLEISRGVVVSSQSGRANSSALLFTSNNVPSMIPTNWPAASTEGIYTAVSGMYPVLINGVNVGYNYRNDPDSIHDPQPRTVLGVSRDKRYLFLMTIDGRQPGYSNGAYDFESGAWLLLVGAHDAVNMDGGGSTTLSVQDSMGKPLMLNKSSAVADSGRQRTVGSHLGVYAKPVPGFINDVTASPDDTTATIGWTTTSPSTSQVQYGPTLDMELVTPLHSNSTTNHAVLLKDLTPDTTYYFKVMSAESGTQYASSNFVFQTTNYVRVVEVFDLSHSWTYTTQNLDGQAWTNRGYDDTGWEGAGPGLLWVDVRATGPNPDVQPKGTQMPANPGNNGYPFITYYFRTHFNYADSLPGATLTLSNFIDDGAVFYLNGVEVYRLNFEPYPAEVLNSSLADNYTCDGDAICPVVFTVSGELAANLRAGDNVLAVEVHNYNARSPDITFGTALSVNVPQVVAPTLGLSRGEGIITLMWARSSFTLQEAGSPAGPWVDAAGGLAISPHTVVASGAARYYRLWRAAP